MNFLVYLEVCVQQTVGFKYPGQHYNHGESQDEALSLPSLFEFRDDALSFKRIFFHAPPGPVVGTHGMVFMAVGGTPPTDGLTDS